MAKKKKEKRTYPGKVVLEHGQMFPSMPEVPGSRGFTPVPTPWLMPGYPQEQSDDPMKLLSAIFQKVLIDPYMNRGVRAQAEQQGVQRQKTPAPTKGRYSFVPKIELGGKKKEKETRYEGPWYGPGYAETEDKYLPSAIYDEPRYMLPLQMAASPFVAAELLARKIASAFQPSYEKPPPEFATAMQAGQRAQQAPPAPQVPQAPSVQAPAPQGEIPDIRELLLLEQVRRGRETLSSMQIPKPPEPPETKPASSGYYLFPEDGGMAVTPKGGKRLEQALRQPDIHKKAEEKRAKQGEKRLSWLRDNAFLAMQNLELSLGKDGIREELRQRYRQQAGIELTRAGVDPTAVATYVTGGARALPQVGEALTRVAERKETGQRQLQQILLRAQLAATLGEANNPRFDTVLENLTQHAGKRKGTLGFAIIGKNGAVEFVDLAGGRGMFRGRATDNWKKGKLKPEQFFTYDMRTRDAWPHDGYGPTRPVGGQVQLIEPMGTKGAAPGSGEASKEMGDTLQKLQMLGPK